MDLLQSIAAQALTPTSDASAAQNPAWLYAVHLLNHGYFWESHEVLEAVWQQAAPNGRERFLVQSVIHVANAALKQTMQKRRAAERLSTLALGCAARAYGVENSSIMGVKRDGLDAAARSSAKDSSLVKISFIW